MNLYEINMKLIGPVHAIGDSTVDGKRLENLEKMIELVDRLLGEISDAAKSSERHESSMKKVGQRAKQFLDDVRQS